jgi:hypothetical protein
MLRYRIWILGLGLLLAAATAARAEPPAPGSDAADVQALAARIDLLIAQKWEANHARPAPVADDATWLRRLYLDVAGKIPPPSEVRRFVRDPAPDKRLRAVERLLDSPGYVSNFTNVYRHILLPEADTNFQIGYISMGFEAWLTKQFTENVRYDKMVHELLTIPLGNDAQRNFDFYGQGSRETPMAFYLAKEGKPENLAATTARVFLGVRVECAQCHDHPFAKWTREQFWGQASFFAGIQSRGQNGFIYQMRELTDRRELPIPGTERVAQASFLDGKEPQWKFKVGARQTLADWMTAGDNPFFARAAANRLWAHFFGIGLVEPVDDFKDENPPSHPELLDLLGREFAAHKFDVKFLVRAITASEAYQLASATTDPTQEDARLFAKMAVRGLTPEQLFDSFAQATGYKDGTPRGQRRFVFGTPRQEFLNKFTQQDRLTEFQTSIPQALALMNSRLIADATSPERSETLGAIVDAPFMDTRGRIEALFLTTLSRQPTPDEINRLVPYVDGGGAKKNSKRALADVFWALLNSAEFILNH